MSEWWSWALSGISCLGLWLAGLKRRSAWVVVILGEVLWTAYALVSKEYGFIIGAVAYTAVAVRNFHLWRPA